MSKKQIQATTKKDDKGKCTAKASAENKDRSGDALAVHDWHIYKYM